MTAIPHRMRLLPLMAGALLLHACGGEFAFKRGASANDLANAKAECQAKASDAAMEKCLEDHGWLIHKMDGRDPLDDDPVATITPSDNRTGEPVVAIGKTAAKPSTAGLQNPAAESAEPPGATAAPPSKPKDPLDVFMVSSWWKRGNSAGLLETDMQACTAQLGEAHAPQQHGLKVTRGLLLCMREKGWYALQAK